MAWIIIILLAAIPLTELFILIDVGENIGGFMTILLCILTAAVGLQLVRLQGLAVFQKMQEAATKGEPIGDTLIHGFFLMLAGIFLFIPGFLTDAVGGLLLIPPLRLFIARAGLLGFVLKHNSSTKTHSAIIIEGEYRDETTRGDAAERHTTTIKTLTDVDYKVHEDDQFHHREDTKRPKADS